MNHLKLKKNFKFSRKILFGCWRDYPHLISERWIDDDGVPPPAHGQQPRHGLAVGLHAQLEQVGLQQILAGEQVLGGRLVSPVPAERTHCIQHSR